MEVITKRFKTIEVDKKVSTLSKQTIRTKPPTMMVSKMGESHFETLFFLREIYKYLYEVV